MHKDTIPLRLSVVNGEIVAAAAEERFSRRKHTGDFPERAIRVLSVGRRSCAGRHR